MSHKKLLNQMLGLVLIALVVTGCSEKPSQPTFTGSVRNLV